MSKNDQSEENNPVTENLDLFFLFVLILKVTIKPYLKLVLKWVSG